MPAPTVKLIEGATSWGGEHWWVRPSASGEVGQRDFIVNTSDIEAAVSALGVPRRGDSWSPGRPDLEVVDVSPRYIGSVDDSSTGTGGWTAVRVNYETPGATGRVTLKKTDRSSDFTEVVWESSTVRQRYDARHEQAPGTFTLPIDNGRGADRPIMLPVAVVHRFRPPTNTPIDLILAAAAAPVNSLALTLPPEQRTLGPITIPPLIARFVGVERRIIDGVGSRRGTEFILRLALAPIPAASPLGTSGHDLVWYQENLKGIPITQIWTQQYLRSDLSQLIDA